MAVERLDHRPIVGLTAAAPRPTKMVVDVVSGDTLTFKTGANGDAQEIRVRMVEKTGHRARLEVCAPKNVKISRNGPSQG